MHRNKFTPIKPKTVAVKIQPLVLKGQDGTAMGKPPKGHNSASLSISVAKAKSFSKVIDLLKSAELGEKCKRNKLPWKIFGNSCI